MEYVLLIAFCTGLVKVCKEGVILTFLHIVGVTF